MALPYSRLNDAMRPPDADDNPANLPSPEAPSAYPQWRAHNVENATDDVGGSVWGKSETYRRLNCRGKD